MFTLQVCVSFACIADGGGVQKYASPSNAHSEELVLRIVDYWRSATTVSPNKEQASKAIKDNNGKKFRATHAKH